MILSTTRAGDLLFEEAWGTLRQKWRAATTADQVLLDDGRPAVRLYVEETGRVAYQTIPPALWADIKAKLSARERLIGVPLAHPKRGRLCQQCGAALTVSKEYGDVWAFRCAICRSVEVLAKNVVGGTPGAGETEKP